MSLFMKTSGINEKDCARKIHQLLGWIIGLNVLDGILTYIGVKKGYGMEVNSLMLPVVTDFFLIIIYKFLLPVLVCLYVALRSRKSKFKELIRTHNVLLIVTFIYIGILFMHAVCIGTAISIRVFYD